ncbi:MAG: hypothetical protein INQ03_05890 [Candidatus Heimdallarchaeota archaeon]|nr:hypothetical protein [Candidatus Heimdallarchaeota archaeon]
MTLIGAQVLKDLKERDIRMLTAVEIGMIRHQYASVEFLTSFTKYGSVLVEKILNKIHKLDLIRRWSGHYIGYELTLHGYDALALNTLYERGVIGSIGAKKGEGKESSVYYALDKVGEEVILKLHRVGFSSFQRVKQKRIYTSDKKHISSLYASRLSAESEVKWLKVANENLLRAPQLLDINRHVIVQELIRGYDLQKISTLEDPEEILLQVLEFIDLAWNKGKFVHGDLSEHNIIITMDHQAVIIDFPQSVSSRESMSREMLERDIYNVLTYFKGKFGLGMDQDEVFKNITTPQPE